MASYQGAGTAAKFNCGLYLIAEQVRGFDPSGFTIAMWAKWRDPFFTDPCLVENPGEDPTFTSSADNAWIFAYNDYQDPSDSDGTPRLTLSQPSGLRLANSGASLDLGIKINDRQWHFLAISVVPSDAQHDQVTLFVDGDQEFSGGLYHDEGFGTPNGKQLGIGCEFSNGSEEARYVGNLAEFQIWKGALGAAKISGLMNAMPDPAREPNLRVLLPLSTDQKGGLTTELVGKYCGKVSTYS